jgi:hypothetical protein
MYKIVSQKELSNHIPANAVFKDTYNKSHSVITRRFFKGGRLIGMIYNWNTYYKIVY